jgi:small subunit ribosomal protein S1
MDTRPTHADPTLADDQHPGAAAPSATGGPLIDEQTGAEIAAAMAQLEEEAAADSARRRAGGSAGSDRGSGDRAGEVAGLPPARAHIRGPRVVQAGREHRTGTVVSVGPTDIFLEFGPKELGVAPRTQWTEESLPKVGDDIEVVVDRFEPTESLFICSRPGTVQKAAWEMLEVGQVVEARVTGVNKGGLELEVAQHRAFMPASQVSLDRVEDLSVFVGEKMTCQVSQVDRRGKGNIVLSRRDVLEVERREKAARLKETLQEGQVVEGIVRKVMPFGAFVDLGGVDGLIHLSDLTYDRVNYGENAVGKHVKVGQAVKVKVLKVDWENNRLSLGLKQTAADPFQTALSDIKEGAEVGGKVVRLTEFGAFIELAPGVDGLVHVSEISHRRIPSPAAVLKVDEVVKAKVLKIDPESRRISLSIRALQPPPEAPAGKGGRNRAEASKRTVEEIMKENPAFRRLKEKFGKTQFKGGLG